MCVGNPPFMGASQNATLHSIKKGELKFSRFDWIRHPEPLKALVKDMLNTNFRQRPRAKNILAKNTWLKKHKPNELDEFERRPRKSSKLGMCFCPGAAFLRKSKRAEPDLECSAEQKAAKDGEKEIPADFAVPKVHSAILVLNEMNK